MFYNELEWLDVIQKTLEKCRNLHQSILHTTNIQMIRFQFYDVVSEPYGISSRHKPQHNSDYWETQVPLSSSTVVAREELLEAPPLDTRVKNPWIVLCFTSLASIAWGL